MSALPTYERCPFLAKMAAPVRETRFDSRPSAPCLHRTATDFRRAATLQVYERTGGLARSDEVLSLLRQRTSQALSLLARWIVDQRVVSFEWQGQRLLPMFQFDPADMTIHRGAAAVLAELSGTFDDWELAAWFAEPNNGLQGRIPIEVLGVDLDAVLGAARADRLGARPST